MIENYTLELYRQMFASIKRGNTKGVFSNAKPVFLISLSEIIPKHEENKFFWGDTEIDTGYHRNYSKFTKDKPTPIWKPFFYMSSESFYELIWKTTPPDNAIKYPSGKTLKDYLGYATLDEELWELLQDEGNREYLRKCIIETFLTKE